MNQNHIQAIQNLGLNEKEAIVYLALLETGKASANSLSLKSGLKRPTTYVILEQLMKKGFAFKIPRARKHAFQAVEIEKCALLAKERLNYSLEILPEIKAIQKGKEEKTSIFHFEGTEGLKEAYDRILKNKKDIECAAFFAHQRNVPDEVKNYWEKIDKLYAKNNIKRKIIIPDDSSVRDYIGSVIGKRDDIALKKLPLEQFDSDVAIEIYDNITLFVSHKHMQASMVEDADIAKTITQIFNLVWKSAEDNVKNPDESNMLSTNLTKF
ncbi:MAG TPA: helix-turn-helix domain-containing protein [Candidatus Moranbacteria bacterium]|nr:helix-turn-helix domain-containing protein [Candidatus Moranbacteria bacterium]